MTEMRPVTIQVECMTSLTVEQIKGLQAMVFGSLRSGDHAKEPRLTIKRKMKAGLNHDVRGVISQVQVNVIKGEKAKAVAKKAEAASVAAAAAG